MREEHAVQSSLLARIIRNAGSQMLGRVFLTGSRFLIAVMIVRELGVSVFGAYALTLSLLLVAECMLDFGMTDWSVRCIARDSSITNKLLGLLMRAKGILFILSGSLLSGWMLLGAYPEVHAFEGLWILVALAGYGAVLMVRVLLKSQLRMHLESIAESIAVFLVHLTS